MSAGYHIHELRGAEIEPWLDALGGLRIRVFREYPYLYDGTLEYERGYLRTYQNSCGSLIVIVTDHAGNAVGATSCLPLSGESPGFLAPFLATGRDPAEILYFGESVLLPEWRGRGLGKEFFKRREAHALRLGLATCAFCCVDRPDDHPLRPAGYEPLDGFWTSLGYVKHPELRTSFCWKEIGETAESPKTLTFWLKPPA